MPSACAFRSSFPPKLVYIEGRLLKAFNLDFSWHKLTTWVNITEQWPLRASSLIVFYETYENKYTDDNIPLKMLYDKVCLVLEQSKLAFNNMRDSDEKKLNAFLSLPHNSLTLADLKIFAPFAINLDPYVKRIAQEIVAENPSAINLGQQSNQHRPVTPSTSLRPASQAIGQDQSRSKLSELSVDGVIALLKQIDGFDQSAIERYSSTLKTNNINGKVLANCTASDLDDLKGVLGFTFGDWLLFKKLITENKQLTHLHTLAPALIPSPSPYHQVAKNQLTFEPARDLLLTTVQPSGQQPFQSTLNSLPIYDRAVEQANNQAIQELALSGDGTEASSLANSVVNSVINSAMNSAMNSGISSNSAGGYLTLPNKPNNLETRLEKQATMEEQALQSDIIEDDEENDEENDENEPLYRSTDSFDQTTTRPPADNAEVDILYIKSNASTKVSPSVSLVEESDNVKENAAGLSEYIPLIEKSSQFNYNNA